VRALQNKQDRHHPHYTCRDRNRGIQSDLPARTRSAASCHHRGSPKLGDYPDATSVYDVDSIGLIRIMDHSTGCDLACPDRARARHPHRMRRRVRKPDWDEIRRLEEKVKAGAEYVMTQPVYDPATVEKFLRRPPSGCRS
jgi:homocysteine S-methyltransferase